MSKAPIAASHRVSLTFVRMAVKPCSNPEYARYALTHKPGTYGVPNPYGADRILYGQFIITTKGAF